LPDDHPTAVPFKSVLPNVSPRKSTFLSAKCMKTMQLGFSFPICMF
jgi:hypothetical protein